jgi:hypothetical protein
VSEPTATEVAIVDEPRAVEYVNYDPNMDFRKLALEAQYFTKGFRLIENKDHLIGVPHVVIGVTYREGFPREGKAGDYVSVEAVVADAKTLDSLPVRSQLKGELAVYANEAVVYNDSGTGIRRYFTELFHNASIINVGKFDPAKVASELNPFDRPYQRWTEGADRATTGIVADLNGEAFRMVAMRGLRRSDYEWTPPEGKPQPATTFYFG